MVWQAYYYPALYSGAIDVCFGRYVFGCAAIRSQATWWKRWCGGCDHVAVFYGISFGMYALGVIFIGVNTVDAVISAENTITAN